MSDPQIAAALARVESVLKRRPEAGIHDDATATARWRNGLRVVAGHDNGARVETDMPSELGGSGDQVSPGWLFRAGLASCTTTSIVMAAATEGVELTVLETRATSRSDTRGLFGMPDVDGHDVGAGPSELNLHVRIAARGVSPERLRSLVEDAYRRSPIPCALKGATTPIGLSIEVDPD